MIGAARPSASRGWLASLAGMARFARGPAGRLSLFALRSTSSPFTLLPSPTSSLATTRPNTAEFAGASRRSLPTKTRAAIFTASSPDRRITASADWPRAVAIAAIVSPRRIVRRQDRRIFFPALPFFRAAFPFREVALSRAIFPTSATSPLPFVVPAASFSRSSDLLINFCCAAVMTL